MLIIRGVNVFPSQIESVLLEVEQASPHYLIIVDRVGDLDTMEVQVEMVPGFEFDAVRMVEKKEQELQRAIESTIGLAVKVNLVSPGSIQRSEGKAKRVIDNRHI